MQLEDGERYTDSRVDEQKRGLSIKAMPVTLLLQSSSEKHYVMNLIDTPGHTNFSDEVTAGLHHAYHGGRPTFADVLAAIGGGTKAKVKLVPHPEHGLAHDEL